MGLSTDVTLPRPHTPKFPSKCLVCHGVPDSTLKIAHNAQNPLVSFFFPIALLFGWSGIAIPVCRRCKPRFRLQRWGRELVCWVLILVAVFLIMPHFKGWSGLTRKVVVGALVLLAITPLILAEVFWPRLFDTTARKDCVEYEFASAEYAAEFHALNESHVLKSEVTE